MSMSMNGKLLTSRFPFECVSLDKRSKRKHEKNACSSRPDLARACACEMVKYGSSLQEKDFSMPKFRSLISLGRLSLGLQSTFAFL
jgi:hypothetical protein